MIPLPRLDRLPRHNRLPHRTNRQRIRRVLKLLDERPPRLPAERAALPRFILGQLARDGVEGFAGGEAGERG